MIQKKIGVFIGFLSLMILIIGFVSAGNCSVVEITSCNPENRVMRLSGATNAHGELWNQEGPYNYVLCCDFTGTYTCSGSNKIIGLSDVTNAHAEIPYLSPPNYETDVCFENLECESTTGSCPSGKSEILSLSDTTNAHIGGPLDYPVKICCSMECDLTSAVWSTTSTVEGNTVLLIVTGSDNCDRKTILFEVLEDEPWPTEDQPAINYPDGVVFSGTSAIGTWTAEWIDDGPLQDDPEYYFIARVVGETGTITSSTSKAEELTVIELGIPDTNCTDIILCGDYETPEECGNDNCSIADEMTIPGIDISCNDPGVDCECSWDSDTETCAFNWIVSDCGNGVIDAGEVCDGNDEWGPITNCTDLGFIGGFLSCDENCNFDTYECTVPIDNEVVLCGDEDLDPGENCDGSDLGVITGCQNFDEFNTVGSLSCDEDCNFDTSQCTGGSGESTPTQGNCTIFENTEEDDCDDGFLTYSWEININWPSNNLGWNALSGCTSSGGDASNCVEFTTSVEPNFDDKWHYDPLINGENLLFTGCRGGSGSRECPAQVQLPFFGWETFLATIIVLGAVYWAWSLKKKRKTSKKKK